MKLETQSFTMNSILTKMESFSVIAKIDYTKIMDLKIKQLLLYTFLLVVIVHATRYDCSSSGSLTVFLEPDEIAFFNGTNCFFNFILNDTNDTSVKYFAAVRKQREQTYIHAEFYYSNDTSFSIDNAKYYMEGYVMFEDWNSICSLESISRVDPFEFTDESQVLYLVNGYNETKKINHPCKWRFTAPINYGFKVVIEIFESDENTRLIIENRTEILLNEKAVKLYHPIYNNDTYIQVYLNNTHPNLRFQAYVTIVKNKFIVTDGGCTFNESTKLWSNYNGINLYGNNQKCHYDLFIFNHTIAHITSLIILNLGEREVDYIGYYDDANILRKYTIDTGYNVLFSPHKNGSTKHVLWEFFSDGSIPGFGFEIYFKTIECECANEFVACGDRTTIIESHDLYCSNMECEFNFDPCPGKFTRLDMFASDDITDSFEIFSNGSKVFDLSYSNFKQTVYSVFLNSNLKNSLKATTFDVRSFYFRTSAFTMPMIISTRVKLTPNNPSYVIDANLYELIFFEISEEMKSQNYAFEIHRFQDNGIFLFNDESLSSLLKEKCITDLTTSNFYTCTIINYKTFYVYWSTKSSNFPPFAAIQLLIQPNISKNCVFDQTIFHQNVLRDSNGYDILQGFAISGISSPDRSCLLTVLVEPYNLRQASCIAKVWTSSHNENIKIFSGIYQNQLMFEYNSTSQNYWKNIALNSPAYTIKIPQNTSIFIVISSIPIDQQDLGDIGTLDVKITQFPYYSVATTTCFGTSRQEIWPNNLYQKFYIGNYPLKFTAIYLNLSSFDTVSLVVGSDSNTIYYNFTNQNDFYIFHNQVVHLITITYLLSVDITNGAIILIESLNNTKQQH